MPVHLDLVTDHDAAQGLRLMRQATANFLRLLSSLDADAMQEPSEIPTWRRSHLVAYLGAQARLLAETAEALRSEKFPLPDLAVPFTEIDVQATLPRIALHHFFSHSAVHLDVELRDLPPRGWETEVSGPTGSTTISALVWQRAEELWWAAVLLRAGQSASALPVGIRQPDARPWLAGDKSTPLDFQSYFWTK